MKIHPRTAVIIPAAGYGTRMHSATPKQYLDLNGKPILEHTIAAFFKSSCISEIIIAVPAEHLEQTKKLLAPYYNRGKDIILLAGGKRRQDSVYKGLQAVPKECEIVLVHDGARPLITQGLIMRCCDEALKSGAAIAAVPVKDTLKKGDNSGCIAGTIDRTSLYHAQTPQAARRELLQQAYNKNGDRDVTDEASLLEYAGIPVKLVTGEETNIKITNPQDLQVAAKLLNRTIQKTSPEILIGHGYDAHRFATGRKLVLGGIEIPHSRGLAGHSDADVLTHSLCDAILGALGEGDIGRHFPDSDNSLKNIYSIKLLEKVMETVEKRELILSNCDITVICQAPKLSPHIKKMKQLLASTCKVDESLVNLKATTTEKMGFPGREEGISCHAVVLLKSQ